MLAKLDTKTASTKAKHLRVLASCLAAAQDSGYTGRNAARLIGKGERPRAGHKEAAYFSDAELAKRWQATPDTDIFGVLFRVAVASGCRLGELCAAQWGDLDLIGGELRVRRSITDGHLGTPKNHSVRSVDLSPPTVELLGRWWGILGEPDDSALVFPGPNTYLSQKIVGAALRRTLKAAGVAEEGSTGGRRTFHSLRHSHARVALEHGMSITSLMRRLGHQSVLVTIGVYGHWESAARKAEASKLDSAFIL